MREISYAKVGEIHEAAASYDVKVIGADGQEITDVVEANACEGWLVRYVRDGNGEFVIRDDELVLEKAFTSFKLFVPADHFV